MEFLGLSEEQLLLGCIEGATHVVKLINDVVPFLFKQLTDLLGDQVHPLLSFLFGKHLDFLKSALEFIFDYF